MVEYPTPNHEGKGNHNSRDCEDSLPSLQHTHGSVIELLPPLRGSTVGQDSNINNEHAYNFSNVNNAGNSWDSLLGRSVWQHASTGPNLSSLEEKARERKRSSEVFCAHQDYAHVSILLVGVVVRHPHDKHLLLRV